MLGIGKYDDYPSLLAMKKDYKNMVHTFHDVWGYTFMYKCSKSDYNLNSSNDESVVIKPSIKGINDYTKNCLREGCKHRKYFKQTWNVDEIDNFVKDVKKEIETNNSYDGLIFIVSSHGDTDDVILDSDCEEYALINIFHKFFAKQCPIFADNPKIIFVDACRGSMRSKGAKFETKDTDNDSKHDEKASDNTSAARGDNDDSINYKGISANKADEKGDDGKIVTQSIHNEANFFKIYANPNGYAAIDTSKGGILINAIKQVFINFEQIKNENIDKISQRIKDKSYEMSKYSSIQMPEPVNTLTFELRFEKYQATYTNVQNDN